MEARLVRAAVVAAAIVSLGAGYRTPNFIVDAPTPQVAEQVGRAAEKYRRELALEWLGQPMPNWSQPCLITVQVGQHLGAGGATSFVFDQGEVFGWRMTIQGPLARILDSVLPHEVTHTIFASHFRQPLPRWADEGASTTVEHASERRKQHKMLVHFLQNGRGIPFSRMFVMKEYPRDILPLYAQGHSLASFLIGQGGKKKFLNYVAEGLQRERWTEVTSFHYGFADLAALQDAWLDWVKRGSPPPVAPGGAPAKNAVAATTFQASKRPRPEPNLIYRSPNAGRAAETAGRLVPVERPGPLAAAPDAYGAGRDGVASRSLAASDGPLVSQVTRPQPVEKARQVVLEWSRQPPLATRSASPTAVRPPPSGPSRPSIYEGRGHQRGAARR